MTVFRRYLLFQLPSWVLAAIVLYGLYRWAGLPAVAAPALWGAYLVKDLVLFRFLRKAYEPGPGAGSERLIGLDGRAERNGYVRVRGELWLASVADGSPPMREGAMVRVEDAEGMRLVVRVAPPLM